MKAGHLIALFLAALAADAAVMQLGTGSGETWTTGLQYPPITAHLGDSLVHHCTSSLMLLASQVAQRHRCHTPRSRIKTTQDEMSLPLNASCLHEGVS